MILLKRGGEFDRGQRYDKEQDYWRVPKSEGSDGVHESGEHQDVGVVVMTENIINDKVATYQEKNADYGDSFGETYRKLGIISAVTRISDKTNRLISLAGKPEAERMVKDENITDTLMDMANYAILTLMELEEAK